MKLSEFKQLPQKAQIDVLYNQGTYVGKRRAGSMIIVLYQVEDFYVEIYYREYRRHISRINCFLSTCFLDPYLDQMNVELLVS